MIYRYGIIGHGVTGILLLLLFKQHTVPPSSIVCIDPAFDGGTLRRHWASIQSNTTWSQAVTALEKLGVTLPIKQDPNSTTSLLTLINALEDAVADYSRQVCRISALCTGAVYSSSLARWTLSTAKESVYTRSVFFCQGAEPKSLQLPVPSIPLPIALSPELLSRYIQPNDTVVVFGMSHSGTLVYNHLQRLGCSVIGVYTSRNTTPFLFARDGAYDGIKQESAAIADSILANSPDTLIPYSDIPAVLSACLRAKKVVYCCGFSPISIPISVDGQHRSSTTYSPITGAIEGCPRAWGFGIAYPSRASISTPEKEYFDVGVASFVDHLLSNLAPIVREENGNSEK